MIDLPTRYASSEEWIKKGEELFGKDRLQWRFVCPSCGHKATVNDWRESGAPEGHIAFSCVGRSLTESKEAFGGDSGEDGGPCNYAGGGLFRLNPVTIAENGELFQFAPYEEDEKPVGDNSSNYTKPLEESELGYKK